MGIFGNWSKDKNNVYFKDLAVEGADSDSFKVIDDNRMAKDKNFEYDNYGKIIVN